jgi:hypothetical protein
MSAEDLTCQAGLACSRTSRSRRCSASRTASATAITTPTASATRPDEQHAFAAAHPDLVRGARRPPRLAIRDGRIAIDSLFRRASRTPRRPTGTPAAARRGCLHGLKDRHAHPTTRIIMHGVTGRMGMNQHLIRSIVAIRTRAA